MVALLGVVLLALLVLPLWSRVLGRGWGAVAGAYVTAQLTLAAATWVLAWVLGTKWAVLTLFLFILTGVVGMRRTWLPLVPRWLHPIAFAYLVLTAYLASYHVPEFEGSLVARGTAWGDWALAWSLIERYVTLGGPTLDFSLHTGTALTYPFLLSWWGAAVLAVGGTTTQAFLLPTAGLWVSMVALSVQLVRQLTGWRRAAWALPALWATLATATYLPHMLSLWAGGLRLDWPPVYVVYEKLWWFGSFVGTHLVPQRTLAFGLAIWLAVATVLAGNDQRRSAWIIAVLIGLAPFAHLHMAIVSGVTVLTWIAWNRWPVRTWLVPALFGVALIGIQLFYLVTARSGASGFAWDHWWVANTGREWLTIWWQNLGIAGGVGLLGWFLLPAKARPFILSTVVIAVLATIGRVQPWDWDTVKLYHPVIVALLIGFTAALRWLWLRGLATRVIAVVAVLTHVGAGAVGLIAVHLPERRFGIWSAADREFAHVLRGQVRDNDVVALAGQVGSSHPAQLAGVPLLHGFRGWLWSYGINDSDAAYDTGCAVRGDCTTSATLLVAAYGELPAQREAELSGRLVVKHGRWQVWRLR